MLLAGIGLTYVKATRFLAVKRAWVTPTGLKDDRAFFLIEDDGRPVAERAYREFLGCRFYYDPTSDWLSGEIGGVNVAGSARASGEYLGFDYLDLRHVEVRHVPGPWDEALSARAGRRVRLFRCVVAGAGIDVKPISLMTTGSMNALEQAAGGTVNPACFRTNLLIDCPEHHAEDRWAGRQLRVGKATLRILTPVPRCEVIGLNPEDGTPGPRVMAALLRYREKARLPDGLKPNDATPGFAVYADVVEPGVVEIGDICELQ